ncbi:hypothetical protein D3C72_1810530 [compost metagenome]
MKTRAPNHMAQASQATLSIAGCRRAARGSTTSNQTPPVMVWTMNRQKLTLAPHSAPGMGLVTGEAPQPMMMAQMARTLTRSGPTIQALTSRTAPPPKPTRRAAPPVQPPV